MANRGLEHNNLVGSENLFPWVHHETIQRDQLSRSPLGSRTNYINKGDKYNSGMLIVREVWFQADRMSVGTLSMASIGFGS